MFYVTITNRAGETLKEAIFNDQHLLFLYLERLGVCYYEERGLTELADGRTFEYGAI